MFLVGDFFLSFVRGHGVPRNRFNISFLERKRKLNRSCYLLSFPFFFTINHHRYDPINYFFEDLSIDTIYDAIRDVGKTYRNLLNNLARKEWKRMITRRICCFFFSCFSFVITLFYIGRILA